MSEEDMKRKQDINFTEGNIILAVFLFALPILAGELLQSLYNSVDSLVVGNFVGPTALAAVGVCNTLSNLLVGFFNGMSVGSTVVVARIFGRNVKDEVGVARAIRYTYSFSVLLGVFLSCLGILLAPMLLHISGANEEVFLEALSYLRIYLAGLMFTVIYNSGAGILRAVGDSRTPFYSLLISSIINIGLDILFVATFSWGTIGVALATVLSQAISVVAITYRIHHRIHGSCIAIRETVHNGWSTIHEAMSIGLFAGMQSAMISFSNLFVWRYINRYATTAVAGISIAQRIDKFVSLPAKSYGQAMTTFVGQNSGAGRYDRIRRGIWQVLLLSWGTILVLACIVHPNAGFFAGLFSDSAEVVSTSVRMMHTIIPFYGFMAMREVLLGVLRGSGKSRMPMILSLVGMVGLRQLFLATVTLLTDSIAVIFFSYPVGWGTTAILLLIYLFLVRKGINLNSSKPK